MNGKAWPVWLPAFLALIIASLLSIYLKVVLPYHSVFDGPWIKMATNDAYFYMRMVDNLLANFPHLNSYDPYFIYPEGFSTEGFPYLFAYVLAGVIKLFGDGSADPQVVDTIAVYIPPVIATLSIIPVYFIGKVLINRWAGVIAAFLVAVMPGELLGLSVLGNTDHHVAEVFLTCCFILFFILSIKDERQFAYSMVVKGQWRAATRNIHYSILAGIFLGLYMATWRGALLFIFLIFIYSIVQLVSDHLRGISTDYLSRALVVCFLAAALVFVSLSQIKITLLSLAFMIAAPIALSLLSHFMETGRIKPVYFRIVIAMLILVGLAAAWIIFPDLIKKAASGFSWIFTWKMQQNVVGEMKPLFFPAGDFTFSVAWYQFGLVFFSGLAGLVFLIYQCVRYGKAEQVFLACWSLIIMLGALAMVRSAIYFAICLAVLTGWLAAYLIRAYQLRRTGELRKSGKKPDKMPVGRIKLMQRVLMPILVGIVLVAVLVTAGIQSVNVASSPLATPGNGWMEALGWMSKNTPEPFGDASYYYKVYDTPQDGGSFNYPDTVYSVVTWADYGYWITRIGHRIPTSNPGNDPLDEARYFIAQDEASTGDLLAKWRAKYVVVDGRLASPDDKFYALAHLSGKKEASFYELCWQKKDDKYNPVLVFYPEYYRSTVVRLFNFDANKLVPEDCLVMQYDDRLTRDGQKFREIIDLKRFKNDNEADGFIASRKQGQYRIISVNPLRSPIGLEQLTNYKLVYTSTQTVSMLGARSLPAVKVFEYTPPAK